MNTSTKYAFLTLSLVLTVSLAVSAEIQVNKGNSVTIDGANSTLIWGQNYSFNTTGFNLYNDTLEINRTGERSSWNISVSSDTSEEVNSTLYRYDLTQQPDYGDTVIKIGSSANTSTQVDYRFTGIPEISSDHYVLRRDGEESETFGSGGGVSWSYDGWGENHNFTLLYEEIPETDEDEEDGEDDSGSSGGSGGGVDVDGGLSIGGRLSDSHTWSFVDRNRFRFDSVKEEIGLETVTVETRSKRSNFKIEVQKLREVSDRLELKNRYSTYSINTSGEDNEINSTTIRFSVNRSFVNQYDRVVLTRYNEDQWNDLPTQPVETNGDKWLYEASSTGFSYYAIKGENNETTVQNKSTGQEENQTDGNQTQEQSEDNRTQQQATELVGQAQDQINRGETGYQVLQKAQQQLQSENYREAERLAQQALQQNQSQTEPGGLPYPFIGLTIIILLLAGFTAYRYYRRRRIKELNQEIATLQPKLREKARKQEIGDPEYVSEKLDEAEKHLDHNNPRKAEQELEDIEDYLD